MKIDAKKLGFAFRLGFEFARGLKVIAQDSSKWITVHPNGKGMTKSGSPAKGQPVLIDEDTGEVLGGMGGKFTGRHISSVPKRGKEEQHGAQANIDRSHAKNRINEKKSKSLSEVVLQIGKQGIILDESAFRNVDSDLKKENFEKFSDLVSKVKGLDEFLKKAEYSGLLFTARNMTRMPNTLGYASVTQRGEMTLELNTAYFKDKKKLIETERRERDSGFHMPCADEQLGNYTIAHEFGHVFHNVIYAKEMEKVIKEGRFRFFDKGKLRNKIISNIRNEVLKLAKKETGEKTNTAIIEKYMSEYGQSNRSEFVAEAMANAFCGKPNPIGRAMAKYIEGFKL